MGHSGRMASKLRPVAPRFIAAIIACWALAWRAPAGPKHSLERRWASTPTSV